ncbi:hypothetical protein CSOJ01_05557 [Colletotrichum sojae]|uniref:F-box domain-containing protein n=1 Tax=Colletotrichum sojae TaxID=2175907 RepID=A0A8H6MXC5_9PEZI|nr:hypothetical protein CSOJ01_05557 [Colletotrichum sojae]
MARNDALTDLPPELLHLHAICSALDDDPRDRPHLLSFAHSCKHIYEIATPFIFKKITLKILGQAKHRAGLYDSGVEAALAHDEPSECTAVSSLPDILRAVLTNQQAASAVQEINFAEHEGRAVLIHNNDIELFVKAAATLGLDTPQPLLRQARPEKQQCYSRYLTVDGEERQRVDNIFQASATATPRGPLLPNLDEVLIEHHIFGHLWSLASSMAPNLTKLQVHHQFNVPWDIRFENVTTLSIEDSLFTEMEFKNVLEGFPRLEALRTAGPTNGRPSFGTSTRVFHQSFLTASDPSKPSSRVSRLDPSKVGSLVRMLPKGLESVDLGRLGGDSVPLLAKTIKESCPGLRLVTCIYVDSDVDGEPTEEEAKEALAEQGIELGVLSRCGSSSDNSTTVDGGNEVGQE